jgi:hypothetical protein
MIAPVPEIAMGCTALLTLLALALPPQDPAPESWETLAEEYELAFMAWAGELQRTGGWARAAAERPVSPARTFWPRFAALAEGGEGRALCWMLRNLEVEQGQRRAQIERLFERVRAAGDADWVAVAVPALVDWRAELEGPALMDYLAALQQPERPGALRVAALLASARLAAAEDAARAAELRLRAALLRWREADLAEGEVLSPELLEELAEATITGSSAAEQSWFARAYREGDDGTYYPRADHPPRPEDTWRPVIETLAEQGSNRARVWVLTHTWAQDDEQRKLLRGHLDAVTRAGLDAAQRKQLSWFVDGLVQTLGADFVEPRVRKLVAEAPEEEQAQFLFGLAEGMCQTATADLQRERGLALLREVQERWPDSEPGKRAEGKLFRYTNLVLGQKIPDFEAEDVEGNAFRLSDYAGKVTVLDFWGFW